MWAEYSWAVRKEPSFAPYWRVLEAVESEITAAET